MKVLILIHLIPIQIRRNRGWKEEWNSESLDRGRERD